MKIDEEILHIAINKSNDFINNFNRYCVDLPELSHNGPYFDNENSTRIILHYYNTVNTLNELSFNEVYEAFLTKVEKLIKDKKLVSNNGVYPFREKKGKDSVNGVLGPAWVLETLVSMYKRTGDNSFLEEAKRIIMSNKYDYKNHVWYTKDTNIINDRIDMTFNHQLWYAAQFGKVAFLLNDKQLINIFSDFMSNLNKLFKINRHGRIHHDLILVGNVKSLMKSNIKVLVYNLLEIFSKPSMKYKENGYHSFNMVAMVDIYNLNRNYKFFTSTKFKKIVDYTFSDILFQELDNSNHKDDINSKYLKETNIECNRYGYSYNVCGFEIAYICRILKTKFDTKKYLDKQLSFLGKDLRKNTEDSIVVGARLYEYFKGFEKG